MKNEMVRINKNYKFLILFIFIFLIINLVNAADCPSGMIPCQRPLRIYCVANQPLCDKINEKSPAIQEVKPSSFEAVCESGKYFLQQGSICIMKVAEPKCNECQLEIIPIKINSISHSNENPDGIEVVINPDSYLYEDFYYVSITIKNSFNSGALVNLFRVSNEIEILDSSSPGQPPFPILAKSSKNFILKIPKNINNKFELINLNFMFSAEISSKQYSFEININSCNINSICIANSFADNKECKFRQGENKGKIGVCNNGECTRKCGECPECGAILQDCYSPKDYAETTTNRPLTQKEFKTLTDIKLIFTEGIKDKNKVMLNLYRVWKDLPDKMKKQLKNKGSIQINSEKWLNEHPDNNICKYKYNGLCESKNFIGFTSFKIQIKETSSLGTIRHELIHAYDYMTVTDEGKKWINIARNVYKDLNENNKYSACPDYLGPKDGVLAPYGKTNWEEDRAVFAQYVYNYPYILIKLLNPKYLCCYDERYKKKLDLALAQGIISQKEYNIVMELANEEMSLKEYCGQKYV